MCRPIILCTPPQVVFEETCVSTCPTTFFNMGGFCQPCSYPCEECTSVSNITCSSCKPNFYLAPNNSCLMACPPFYYRNDSLWQCEPCPSGCVFCFDANLCSLCANGYYQFNYSCLNTCPIGYFNLISTCAPCHQACGSCTYAGQSNCTSCSSGYYWAGPTTCVMICSSGLYPSGDSCIPCPNNCSKCSANGICETCLDDMKSNGVCCPPSNYFNLTSNQCESCASTCLVCNDSSITSCTKCDYSRGDNGVPILGTCPCRSSYLETYEVACAYKQTDSRKNYVETTYMAVLVAAVLSFTLAATS
jgi:proprotein convertase subtilisin/kexin type 5